MRVLSLCDYSGIAIEPWVRAGYDAEIVDLLHESGAQNSSGITRIGRDIRHFEPKGEYNFVFAFPPCTHLAVSGARWFRAKGLLALAEGIELVARCAELCERIGAPYLIENPVGTLSTYWREPDFYFDPCDYAGYLDDPEQDAYTKRTCLWTGAGFVMPTPKPVFPILGSKMHLMSPSETRDQERSVTPRGFAEAVFQSNHRGGTSGA